jgi:hypothetical protein
MMSHNTELSALEAESQPDDVPRRPHRTGVKKKGRLGETIIFAGLLLLGCAALGVMLSAVVVPEWQANREFIEHRATVLAGEVVKVEGDEGVSYRPLIKIQYEIDGHQYQVETYDINTLQGGSYTFDREEADRIIDDYTIGEEISCWYDTRDNRRAVVQRGYRWWIWPFLAVPIAVMAIGGGGLILALRNWGKSREYRAATGQRGAAELFDEPEEKRRVFPSIPSVEEITNSPGTTLSFRLPISTSRGWKLMGTLLLCLFWNGIVAIFVVVAVRGHLSGAGNWLLTLLLLPFVAVGGWSIYYFFRQLLVTTGVGPTRMEISLHPIHPGEECEILVSQTGRLSMHALEIHLTCDESATYQQGTDTRTESHRVYEQQVFSREKFEIEPASPYEGRCSLRIPADAMHSFKSDHNEVTWQLRVRGRVARWPEYERSFPVIVHPRLSAETTP